MTKFWQQAENEGVVLELPPLQTVSQRRSFFWGNSDRKPWLDIPKNRAKLWHEANEAEAKFLEEYEKNFPWGRDVGSSKIEESLRAAPIKCGEPGYPSIECGGRPGGELEQKKE